jgi:molybdate transport system regulatory protein
MKISARNQLIGNVIKIKEGAVNSIAIVNIGGGNKVSATISLDAIKELGLAVGSEVIVVIKSTSVMVATANSKISARNQLSGKVAKVNQGAVNAIVVLDIAGFNKISATISLDAVKELGLAVGSEAIAVIKSTSVMLATK